MGKVELVLILMSLFYGSYSVDLLVETSVGLIRGLTAPDGTYSMFLGIPYATVDPENPFGTSIPHPLFESTFDAFNDSAVCPQYHELDNTLIGTLDCLHLHIYVPNNASSINRVPVMVWFHGGGFQNEFGARVTHTPRFLLRHDVIVVILTYRVGAYGFLCLDTPEVPGNQGLKDQLYALRWVKNNIEAFGGDANQITIFGESAGALSVDFHLIYAEDNLFNNVIIQSGTIFTPYTIVDADPSAALKLAEHIGFNTSNVTDALAFLRTVDTDFVVSATYATNLLLKPCVEKEFENVERYVPENPINMNLPKKNIAILIGLNSNEAWAFIAHMDSEMLKSFNPFDEIHDHFEFEKEYGAEMEDLVRRYYIGDEDVTEDVKIGLSDFISDVTFSYPTHRTIEKNIENEKIFLYMFSYEGDRNYVKRRDNITVSGAIHADEISYLFEVSFITETPTSEDQLMIDRMTTMWTNFAKFNNPIPETTDLLPVEWPVVTNESFYYMNIDSEFSVQQRPFYDRVAFWELFYTTNRLLEKGFVENQRDLI